MDVGAVVNNVATAVQIANTIKTTLVVALAQYVMTTNRLEFLLITKLVLGQKWEMQLITSLKKIVSNFKKHLRFKLDKAKF